VSTLSSANFTDAYILLTVRTNKQETHQEMR